MRMRLVVVVALAALACSGRAAAADDAALRQALEFNQAKWAHQQIRDYRYRLRVSCFCGSYVGAVTITVRNGRARPTNRLYRHFDTVPKLFAGIRGTLDQPDHGEQTIRYDLRRGFPRTASLDPLRNAIDDEVQWTVDRFRPLPRTARSEEP